MLLSVLGSGSRGNALYVQTEQVRLLVDAGLNARETQLRLSQIGAEQRIDAILLTHEHHDHVNGVSAVAKAFGATVWTTPGTSRVAAARLKGVKTVSLCAAGEPFQIGDLTISPIRKPHDAADPVAFVIEHENVTLGCFTDLGSVDSLISEAITRCTAIVMEANHDPLALAKGPYPAAVKSRISSELGHLSNEDSALAIARYASPRLRHLVLAHLSETNNSPALVREAYLRHMGPKAGVERRLSSQERPTSLLDLRLAAPSPLAAPAAAAAAAPA